MNNADKISVAALLGIGAIIFLNRKKLIAKVTGGSAVQSEHDKIQEKIYRDLVYYGTPRGAMTGVGGGVDLFGYVDKALFGIGDNEVEYTHTLDGVLRFVYKIARYNNPKMPADGWKDYDYTPFLNWYKSGVYTDYRKNKNSGIGVGAIVKIAFAALPLIFPPAAPVSVGVLFA